MAFFIVGMFQLRDAMGWPGFGIGLARAVVVMLVALVAARARGRRAGARSR